MSRRKPVAAVAITALLLAATWVVTGQLRERAVFAAALAALGRNGVVDSNLDPPPTSGPTVFLVVGSDRRHVRTGSVRDIRGERADAIMLWAVDDAGAAVASLPRDLRVHVPGHGDSKLGGSLEYGPNAVIDGVRSLTGLPVHHYVELEFSAVTTMVDRLGGIGLDLARPVRDVQSGLALPAGSQSLDGREALAYVRSREYQELDGDAWATDPTGDIGRIARQHLLLAKGADALAHCGLLTCLPLASGLGGSVTVDQAFTGSDLRHLASAFVGSRARLSFATLPTAPERTAENAVSPFPPLHIGNVGYRRLVEPAARAVLRQLVAGVGG